MFTWSNRFVPVYVLVGAWMLAAASGMAAEADKPAAKAPVVAPAPDPAEPVGTNIIQRFTALEQRIKTLEAQIKLLEGRLAQVAGLPNPNTAGTEGNGQPPNIKDIKKPTIHAGAPCCAIAANPALKGRFGRIVVAFPKGAKTDTVRIEVYKPGGTEELTSDKGSIGAELLPGTYDVLINNKRVKGVQVKARHDTRVHVGVLRVKLSSDTTRWEVRDVGAKDGEDFNFSRGTSDMGLPIGTYEVVVNKQADKVTIQTDKISEF